MSGRLVFYMKASVDPSLGFSPSYLLSSPKDHYREEEADYVWSESPIPSLRFVAEKSDRMIVVDLWHRRKDTYVYTGKLWAEAKRVEEAVAAAVPGVRNVRQAFTNWLVCEAEDSVEDLESLAALIGKELCSVSDLLSRKPSVVLTRPDGREKVNVVWGIGQ